MTTDRLPDGLKSATVMTPMELNKVRFVKDHTVITPEILEKMRAPENNRGPEKPSLKK